MKQASLLEGAWHGEKTSTMNISIFKKICWFCVFTFLLLFNQVNLISQPLGIDNITTDSVSCNGGSDGKITVTISGGIPPYIYVLNQIVPVGGPWSIGPTNSTSAQFTNLTAGLYQITVVDDNGSGDVVGQYATVKQPAILKVDPNAIPNSFCEGVNTQLNGNPTGGNGGFTHIWSGTGAIYLDRTDIVNPIFNCNIPGSYTLKYKVVDYKGCADSLEKNITVYPLPIVTFGGSLTPQCANSTTYALSGGSPAGGVYSGPGVSGNNFNASASGGPGTKIITYTYTDANGCSNSATNTIDVLALPTASASNNGPVCEGTTLQLFGSGSGTAPIGYSWSGPSFTSTQQNPIVSASATTAMSGTYTLTVTDGNGCQNTATTDATVVAQPAAPTGLTAQTRCGNGPLSFNASAANPVDSIQWSLDGSTVIFTSETPSVYTTGVLTAPTTINVYARVKTKNGGCLSNWANTTGTAYLNPTPTASSNSPVCVGSSLTLSALPNGMTSYSWTGPGFTSTQQNPLVTASATLANAGTYTVTVVDGNGCSGSANTNVTVNPLPNAFNVTGGGSYCAGGSGVPVGLSGSQVGVNYQLRRDGVDIGSPVAGTGSAISFGSQTVAGTYTVVATNASTGCTRNMNGSAVVTVNTPPTPTASNNGPVCEGNTLSLTGGPSSGVTYAWSGPNGFTSAQQSPVVSSSATTAMSGSYKLVITDTNGCKDSTTTVATVNAKPSVTASSNSPVCGGSTLELYGGPNGMAIYSWTGPLGYTSSAQNPTRANAMPSFSGTYTLTVTDLNGCTNSTTTSVTVLNIPPILTYTLSDPTVCYYEDAVITLSGSQAGNTYTIFRESDNVQVTAPQTGTGASLQFTISASNIPNVGNNQFYCLVLTPQNCPYTVTDRAIINKRAEVIKNLNITNAPCNGQNGTISAIGSGGTAPYTMSINGTGGPFGSLTQSVAPNSYQVVLKDANNCLSTVSNVVITEPAVITFGIDSASPSCSGSNNGYINFINVAGGTPPYQYSIRGDDIGEYQASPNFTGLGADNYYCIIKDANGCLTDTLPATLTAAGQIFVGHTLFPSQVCFGDSGTLILSASGGSGNYQFSISQTMGVPGPWSTNASFSISSGVNYYGFARDVNTGCVGYANNGNAISIASAPKINIFINSIVPATCYNTNDGQIRLGNSTGGNGGPYTYYVDGISNGTRNFTNLAPGNHTITVIDNQGCSEDSIVNVPSPPAIVYDNITTRDLDCPDDMSGEIHIINPSGGTPPLQYTINTLPYGSSTDFTGLDGGTYDVKIRDAVGCINSTLITVNEPSPITITSAMADSVCAGGTGNIVVTATGGNAPLTYTLNPGSIVQNNGTFTNLSAGTYTITVSDSKSCPTDDTTLTIINSIPPTITVSKQNVKCFGGTTGSITIGVVNGKSPFQYSINGDIPSQYQASPIFTNLSAGTYDVYVKDACGTYHYGTVNILQPASAITITSINTTPVSGCKGTPTGSLTINATGGSGTILYSINGGTSFQASNTFNNLFAGTYNIVVQDDSLCQDNDNAIITEPNLLKIDSISTTRVNEPIKGTATVHVSPANSGAGNLVYWYDNQPSQASNVFTNLDVGTYMAYVRDQNNCIDSMQFEIKDTLALTLIVNVTPVSCYGSTDGKIDTATIGGTPPFTLTIVPAVPDLSNVSPGTYTVTVTDALSRTDTKVVDVTEPTPVGATYVITNYNGTPGTGSIVVNGTGGNGGYQYSFDNGPFSSTNTFTDLAPGTYRVVTTDSKNCAGPDTTIEIYDDAILQLYPPTHTDVTCYGSNSGTATIRIKSGTAPFIIRLRKGATTIGTVVTNLREYTFTNLSAGTYQFNVRHSLPGPSVNSPVFDILEQATSLLTITNKTVIPQTDLTPNGEIRITAAGGVGSMSSYQFSIDSGATFQLNAGIFTGLYGDSIYQIAVKDLVGCIIYDTVYLPSGLPLNVQFSKTNETCAGLNDGTITYKVISGKKPYQFSFNGSPFVPAADSMTFTMLPPGTYTLDIADANDTVSYVANIDPASAVVIDTIITTPASNGGNGTMTVLVSGGSGIYTFSATSYHHGVFNNGNNNVFTNLPADTFNVRVDDVCSFDTEIAIVPQDTVLLANVSIDPIKCIQPFLQAFINVQPLNAAPGLITYEATHAITSDYYIQFNDGNIEVNDSGTYYIHVVDSEGKHFRDTVTVTSVVTPIVITFDPIIQPCISGGTSSIYSNVSGGAGPYTYKWYNKNNVTVVIDTNEDLINYPEGKYILVVTDSYNCSVQKEDSITASPVKILSVTTTPSTCNVGITNGTISVTAVGKGTLSYIWDNGLPNSSYVTGLGAGTYSLTVMNESGCSDSRVITVSSIDSLMNLWTFSDQTCDGEGFVEFNVSKGHPLYTFIQIGTDTTIVAGSSYRRDLVPGTYDFKLIDQKGCYDSLHLVVNPKPAFDTIVIDSVHIINPTSGPTGTITVYATGTLPQLIYKIRSSTGSVDINNGYNNTFTGLIAGTYYIEVTDDPHCATAYDTVVLTADTVLNVNLTIRDSICNGAVIYITPLNAYGSVTYSVTTDSSQFFVNQLSDSVFAVSNTGVYHIYVYDSEGKFFRKDTLITVAQPALFAVVDNYVNPECNIGTTGSIFMRVNGGTSPYDYAWLTLPANDTISKGELNLIDQPLGIYKFVVTDAAGCEFTHIDSIVKSEALIVAVDTVKSHCSPNKPTGKIVITMKGKAPFFVTWLNNEDLSIIKEGTVNGTKDSVVNVPVGKYFVRVIDANSCFANDTIINLEAYNPLHGSIAFLELPKCYSVSNPTSEGSMAVTMLNGFMPFAYSWLKPENDEIIKSTDSVYALTDTIVGIEARTYRILVRDSDYCTFDTLVNVAAADSIDFDFLISRHATCKELGKTVITFSKGAKPFQYSWSIQDSGSGKKATGGSGSGPMLPPTFADSLVTDTLRAARYLFTLVDDSGCVVTKPIVINQSEYFQIDSIITYEKCNSYGAVALQVSQTAYPLYLKWNNQNDTLTFLSGVDPIPVLNNLNAGVYQARIWNNIGCDTIKTFLVKLDDTLKIDTVIRPENCTEQGSIEIKVLNSSYPFMYQWIGSNTTITKTDNDTIYLSANGGQYIISIWNNEHKCSRIDTITLPLTNPLIVDAGRDTTICRGVEYILQGKAYSGKLLDVADGALFNWSPAINLVNNRGNIPNPIIKAYIPNAFEVQRTEYVLNVTLGRCQNSDTVVISYHPTNGVWLPAIDTASKGEYRIVPVIGGTGNYVRYMWTPRSYVLYDTDTSRILVLNFKGDSLTYYFTGITEEGCFEHASVLVVASDEIFPDDAFTPNGDGINDFWYIPNAEFYPDIYVQVFNRWGDKVFESRGYNNADKVWNGKRKGKDLPIGTYYYVITMNGAKTKKGTVAIIR